MYSGKIAVPPGGGGIGYNNNNKAEYSLREFVSAQGREGRGFDSDPGRKKKAIFYLVIRKSR
jgi:hypothetical protein